MNSESRWAATSTLVITNLIKLGGLGIGIKAGLTTQNAGTMLFAAFMMAGAHVSETLLLSFFERFFGKE